MKQNEAEQLIIKMKQLWGNPFKVTSTTAMEWAQHAGDVPFLQMSKAIDYFAQQGDKFPPSLAEVVSKAKALSGPRKYRNAPLGCVECGGPTLSGEKHFRFCPTDGTGEFMISTMKEHTAWIDQ